MIISCFVTAILCRQIEHEYSNFKIQNEAKLRCLLNQCDRKLSYTVYILFVVLYNYYYYYNNSNGSMIRKCYIELED